MNHITACKFSCQFLTDERWRNNYLWHSKWTHTENLCVKMWFLCIGKIVFPVSIATSVATSTQFLYNWTHTFSNIAMQPWWATILHATHFFLWPVFCKYMINKNVTIMNFLIHYKFNFLYFKVQSNLSYATFCRNIEQWLIDDFWWLMPLSAIFQLYHGNQL